MVVSASPGIAGHYRAMNVAELQPGLWRWTAPHPAWHPDQAWPQHVGSIYAETADAIVLIDPLVPADDEERFWTALDGDLERLRERPVLILLTCAWHRRSADAIAERYDASIWHPGEELPEGVEAARFDDDAQWSEVVFHLARYRAVVFGDVIEGDGAGGLRMPAEWWPIHNGRTTRVRRELRRVLAWPFEVVLVSHGDPILRGGRSLLAHALEM
jgi:hypothetical protein